jgi:hypothetical protein
VDEQWLLLGSPNLDPRSLVCNTEIVLVIRGREIAEHFASLHDRFRLNRNSWVVAETSAWRRPQWWTRMKLAWYRLTGRGRSPYRDSRCFEPREGTPDCIPDPDAEDFAEQYRCCGIYPGVDDSETRIELVLLESLSTIFRRLL